MHDARLTFSLRGTRHDNNRFNSVVPVRLKLPGNRPASPAVVSVDFSGLSRSPRPGLAETLNGSAGVPVQPSKNRSQSLVRPAKTNRVDSGQTRAGTPGLTSDDVFLVLRGCLDRPGNLVDKFVSTMNVLDLRPAGMGGLMRVSMRMGSPGSECFRFGREFFVRVWGCSGRFQDEDLEDSFGGRYLSNSAGEIGRFLLEH